MSRYDFATVELTATGVCASGTDASELDWMYAQVKAKVPSCSVKESKADPDRQTYYCQFHKLSNWDSEVVWWIVKLLCRRN